MAAIVDLPTTTPILTALFGGDDYWVVGAGGDLCLPGAIEYQTLHYDHRETFELTPERLAQAQRMGVELRKAEGGEALTDRTRHLVFERTPPRVTINFLMSDMTFENGPIRQIAGTQTLAASPPTQADEPEWMRLSTVVGAPAGAGVCPRSARLARRDPERQPRDPRHAQRRVRRAMAARVGVRALDAVRYLGGAQRTRTADLRPDQDRSGVWPAGAGVMHPLASKRSEAKGSPSVRGRRRLAAGGIADLAGIAGFAWRPARREGSRAGANPACG
ncbi:MAG: hypothetical protein WDM85_13560 [Caulobacteraceae bacterium]